MLNKLQPARVDRIVEPPERQARASGGWTITPFTAVLICIALSACQTYPSTATTSVSCSAATCDGMWRYAQAWVAQNSAYRIRLANDVVIETFGPLESGPVSGLAYKLVKTSGAGRAGTISITSACKATIYGCINVDPSIGATKLAKYLRALADNSAQSRSSPTGTTTKATPTQKTARIEWQFPQNGASLVKEFIGSGMVETQPFLVSGPWEIQWDARGEVFAIFVYSADGSLLGSAGDPPGARPSTGAMTELQPFGLMPRFQLKPGRYYLQINAIGNWAVRVVRVE